MTRRVIGRTCGAITVLSILLAGGGPTRGADAAAGSEPSVIFDNTGVNGGLSASGASPGSQSDTFVPFESGAADDFTLPDSPLCRWSVTGVRWTGVYWDTWPGNISAFRIIVWPDDGGAPAGGGATPNLAEALKSYLVAGNAGETSRGAGVYDYEAQFPEAFEALPGVRYWIEVQAVMDYPPQWGWHVTANRQGAGPVEYFDMLRTPAWTPIADPGDLAFALLGSPADLACDDGDACTTDSCVAGQCVFEPVTCDDGSACTEDSCSPEQGCMFTAISCDDDDGCTADACDAVTGCTHDSVPCDDGDACTEDSCSPQEGCVFSPIGCDDADACTTDACDPVRGCTHEAVQCDDGNACTTNTCDAANGCVTQDVSCDDGDACTTDRCDPAAGCLHEPLSCDDGNACTTDTCDPASGCTTQEVFCDDGDACTADACDPQMGCTSTAADCDDQDACTVDTCDPAGGCVSTPMDCGDGDACTVDLCVDGECVHVPPPDFDGDGMVGPADFAFVATCIGGPTVAAESACSCADLNGDGRVDLGDYAVLQMRYSGNKP